MKSLLIRNIGTLQTPQGSFSHKGSQQGENLKIKNAVIVAIDGIIQAIYSDGKLPQDPENFDIIIDAEGSLVTPGLVDAHTHLVLEAIGKRRSH